MPKPSRRPMRKNISARCTAGPIPRMITSCGFMPRCASMRRRIKGCMMQGSAGRRNRGCLLRPPGRRVARMYYCPSPAISRTKTARFLTVRSNVRNGLTTTAINAPVNLSDSLRMLMRWRRLFRSASPFWLAITANVGRVVMRNASKTA